MANYKKDNHPKKLSPKGFRNFLANNMGITQNRKEEIYRDLLRSVSLQDISYWLQVLFSAAIATLGLVLNSPAVIIGAMLISPLMGMILANGLAFAVGDLILAVRAIVNLTLSCLLAVGFAFLLVGMLPFKELTSEIAARTQPNVLDLAIALFSGALGSIATCKEPKGVVTSIPGVAIAVALMPPLCVVGYGIGVKVSLNLPNGLEIARGGALLFLTNLTAITLMAMVVFLTLNIDTLSVRQQVREWHSQDPESHFIQKLLEKFPISRPLEIIGSLPSRFIVILIPVVTLLFPLSQSLTQLQKEITEKQRNNKLEQIGQEIWQENFAKFSNGETRSDIGKLVAIEQQGKLVIQLSVFTNRLYSPEEKKQYTQLVASDLGKNPDAVEFQLVEIPTATNEIITNFNNFMTATELLEKKEPVPQQPPTLEETHTSFLKTAKSALETLTLPPPAQLLHYEIVSSTELPLSLNIIYLSEREIDPDAKSLLIVDIKNRLKLPNTNVKLQRVPVSPGLITFEPDSTELQPANIQLLTFVAQILKQQPNLSLEITADFEGEVSQTFTQKRVEIIQEHLISKLQIPSNKITLLSGKVPAKRTVTFRIKKMKINTGVT
ncbi:MAG: DUF389 domain-containing protein [Nostocaceae cyanobacterium]|nr:DUF389 domain-containing protein [Nostocaceae cyanobacterium]